GRAGLSATAAREASPEPAARARDAGLARAHRGAGMSATEARPEPDTRLAQRVVDADPERAERTEVLLRSLADRLGLRVGAIRVHVDAEAARRTRPRGARGLMQGGAIWLDPDRYDPRSADGRALLAHEAAHAAQALR